jgi:hypothetical protein
MAPYLGFSQLLLVALGVLCLLIHVGRTHAPSIAPETSPTPNAPTQARHSLCPLLGFIPQPLCDA